MLLGKHWHSFQKLTSCSEVSISQAVPLGQLSDFLKKKKSVGRRTNKPLEKKLKVLL